MTKKTKFIIAAIIILIVAFYAGTKYGQISGRSPFPGANGGAKFQQGGMRGNNGGFIDGEIIAKDENRITVKLRNGGSKIIFLPILSSNRWKRNVITWYLEFPSHKSSKMCKLILQIESQSLTSVAYFCLPLLSNGAKSSC